MYIVIERERCRECNGTGGERSRFWGAVADEQERRRIAGAPEMSIDEIDEMARAMGCSPLTEPAIITCPVCHGVGWIMREVPLSWALKALGVEVK